MNCGLQTFTPVMKPSHRNRSRALLFAALLPTLLDTALATAQPPQRRHTRPAAATGVAKREVSIVSDCYLHGTTQVCMAGTTEYQILTTLTATTTQNLPASYTGCHNHGSDMYCVAPGGDEVGISLLGRGTTAHASEPTSTGVTAVSECHLDASMIHCVAGTEEYKVVGAPTATTDIPAIYTGCHSHGSDMFCIAPDGEEVEVLPESAAVDDEPTGKNCHFHAGVEHCVGGSSEESGEPQCDRVDRDYNIPLRIGLIFVILATSAIGVFTPILLTSFSIDNAFTKTAILVLRQFGTGVVISTAFVHLYTHATLMFTNECLGELSYESTTSAILMAGLLLSFVVEYAGHRFAHWQASKSSVDSEDSATSLDLRRKTDMTSIMVLEAGIIFHSLLIGLTLVVAGDSFFLTLFAVIVFHQMFEGVALGSRIAALGSSTRPRGGHAHGISAAKPAGPAYHVATWRKLALGTAFAVVTPVGMAIGVGVLGVFNGNDPSTVVAIGTLDALSAGILVWVGVVEMWAADWMPGGEMAHAGAAATLLGGAGLLAGMVLMSVLGKWA